jgi:NNP family nitrate/nitrite transporter-like MFS transporter
MAESVDTGEDKGFVKFDTYDLPVDSNQNNKATRIKLCSFARPHMRAFHCSWWSFFIAFFIWFAIAPLLPEVKDSLDITKQDIWTSNICSVAGTIVMRFALGPLCDKFGARVLMGAVLMAASIPCSLIGLVKGATSLAITRFFIGLGGSTFVMCQYWTTTMFTKETVGTANALVGGWGNLGGGVTQIVMGSVLFPLFKTGMSANMAWRTVSIVPAIVGLCTGLTVLKISDDCPNGNYKELKSHGVMKEVSAAASFRTGAMNINTWLLFIQYACCFGVELTMNNAAASYFKDTFDLSTESAAAIASIFGWMNLFARGLGGFTSDKFNAKMGMRGRLLWQSICLLIEGIMVLIFAQTKNLGVAIFILVIFSSFVQAAEGSSYGIVPYVNPAATGSISGIVGAGGNTGAVCFGLGFRQMTNIIHAFNLMGFTIIGSSFLSVFIFIKGHRGLLTGEDSEIVKAAWMGKIIETDDLISVPLSKTDDPEALSKTDGLEQVSKKDELEALSKKDELEPLSKKDELEPLSTKDDFQPLSTKDDFEQLSKTDAPEP